MRTVNPAFLSEVNRTLVARFMNALGRVAPLYQRFTQIERSTSRQTIYGFMDAIGGLREWIGDRKVTNFSAYDFAIKNRHFERTVRVNRDDLEDDQFGFYGNIAANLGDAAGRHPDSLVTSLVANGFTNLCADGAAFFSTAHPNPLEGGANQSNKGTTALSVASYAAAQQQMRALTDAGGLPLNITPDVLMVGPPLWETGLTILKDNPVFVSGVPQNNHWVGSAELVVNPALSDANDWFLFDTTKILKPFIMQFRKDPQLVSLQSLTDENVFKRNEFLWGVDYRGEAGYALWQLAFGASV